MTTTSTSTGTPTASTGGALPRRSSTRDTNPGQGEQPAELALVDAGGEAVPVGPSRAAAGPQPHVRQLDA